MVNTQQKWDFELLLKDLMIQPLPVPHDCE